MKVLLARGLKYGGQMTKRKLQFRNLPILSIVNISCVRLNLIMNCCVFLCQVLQWYCSEVQSFWQEAHGTVALQFFFPIVLLHIFWGVYNGLLVIVFLNNCRELDLTSYYVILSYYSIFFGFSLGCLWWWWHWSVTFEGWKMGFRGGE